MPVNEARGLGLYSLEGNDPFGQLFARYSVTEQDLAHINELMEAMGYLRSVERKLSEASARYMKLNNTDMRVLHYILNQANQGVDVTPSMVAAHVDHSAASITKVVDRLEAGGHLVRRRHPHDRRVTVLEVTPQTRKDALASMGQYQIHRVKVALELPDEERKVIIKFLQDTADELARALAGSEDAAN